MARTARIERSTSESTITVELNLDGTIAAVAGALRPGERMTVTGPLGTGFPAPDPGCCDLLVAADRDIRESHVLHLDDEAWDSFVRALDEPMPEEMVRLLESEPIWK